MILFSLLISTLVGTIICELLLALLLGVNSGNDFLNIVLVNIMTNPFLVIFTLMIKARYGSIFYFLSLLIMEVLTVFVEGYVYDHYLSYKKIRAYNLSLILNLFSFIVGLFFSYI